MIVPLLLQTPWFFAQAMLPPLEDSRDRLTQVTLLKAVVLVGQSLSWLLVSAMLRFRARSVFNTPGGRHAPPVLECYRQGVTRVPALFVTESLRNVSFWVSGLFLIFPVLYTSFKLSMATEAVVLRDGGPFVSFSRSFHLTEGRFERWLEMIVISVVIVLGICFFAPLLYLAAPGPGWEAYVMGTLFVVIAVLPVIQYAWTFFYLRLEEIDVPVVEVGPNYAALDQPANVVRGPWPGASGGRPDLRLVEVESDAAPEDDPSRKG
ncbi:MAG: hypothetical protein ABIU54_12480 [Candidatus Eisenbacteria bacterium]